MRPILALALAILALPLAALDAQDREHTRLQPIRGDHAELVTAVLSFRWAWIGEPTVFDACQIHRILGLPSGFPGQLPERVLPLLDHPTTPCDSVMTKARARARRLVTLDSSRVFDSTATVFATVRRGEYHHRETYHLASRYLRGAFPIRQPTSRWGVTRVEIWGAMQFDQGDYR